MFYPRETKDGKLVSDDAVVGYREHLANKHRIIYYGGIISDETDSCNLLIAFDSLGHDPIKIIINSPGGILDSAFMLYDTIRMVQSPVYTLGRCCASAAVMILAAGKKRYLMPHSRVMIHLPSGTMSGDAKDWQIQQQEMETYKQQILDIYRECGVKKSKEEIIEDIDRDFWMNPQQTIDYGLCDSIMMPDDLHSWLTTE
jgi:ATP-dependent Clp protease protease subunit